MSHTCAETPGNKAYCWGDSSDGRLGIGTLSGPETCSFNLCSTRPLAVAGGLSFAGGRGGATHLRPYRGTPGVLLWRRLLRPGGARGPVLRRDGAGPGARTALSHDLRAVGLLLD